MTRLYLTQSLGPSQTIELSYDQHHYLEKVLRFESGQHFFGFNERDGEWKISYQKPLYVCIEQVRATVLSPTSWLAFSPLKNDPMNFLIEKATELGVTDLQPLITERTNTHRINLEKIRKNTIEAAQQCERLDLPTVHEPVQMHTFLKNLPLNIHWYASIERSNLEISAIEFPAGFIIGPEGGWSKQERALLENATKSISLGKNILRAETAAIVCLGARIFLKTSNKQA